MKWKETTSLQLIHSCDKLMNAYYSGNEKIDYKSIGDYMEAAINYLEGVELSLEAIDWLS